VSNGKTAVKTDAAPGALGPYSQAIVAGGMVYCAGQIPLDPATGSIVSGQADVYAASTSDYVAVASVLVALIGVIVAMVAAVYP